VAEAQRVGLVGCWFARFVQQVAEPPHAGDAFHEPLDPIDLGAVASLSTQHGCPVAHLDGDRVNVHMRCAERSLDLLLDLNVVDGLGTARPHTPQHSAPEPPTSEACLSERPTSLPPQPRCGLLGDSSPACLAAVRIKQVAEAHS
jgi:hypothetical protein